MALRVADHQGLLFPKVLEKGFLAHWANQPFERGGERRAHSPLGSSRSATARCLGHDSAPTREPLTRPNLMSRCGSLFGLSRVGVGWFGFFLARARLGLLGLRFRAGLFLRVGVGRSLFLFFLIGVRVLSRRSPNGHDGRGAAR